MKKILWRLAFAGGAVGLVAWFTPLASAPGGSIGHEHPAVLIGLVFGTVFAATFEGKAWEWR